MRILIWTDAYYPEIGGLEVFCLQLARGMRRLGHEVEVITNLSDDAEVSRVHEGIPVHRFSFTAALGKRDLATMRVQNEACAAVLDRFDADVIHLNLVQISLFNFCLQQRRRRRPVVMTLHDAVPYVRLPHLPRQAFQLADKLVAISESVRTKIAAAHPEFVPRLQTILNALPMPDRPPEPPPADQSILAFGRLVHEKGFDLALKAFARIAADFPEATLTIAGNGTAREALEAMAAQTGFAPRIHFTGWITPEEIDRLIGRHALVVMPSRWEEPFGLAALQTAQAGRPIVATRRGGLPEIVVDGETGIIVPVDDLDAMAQAFRKLLAQPALRREWGEAAWRRARDHFDFDQFLRRYESVYADCAATAPTREAAAKT